MDRGPRPIVRRLLGSAILAATLAAAPSPAHAHLPPPVYFVIKVTDEVVRFRLVVNYEIFSDWFGIRAQTVTGEEGALTDETRRGIEGRLAEWLEVKIDRVPVKGVLEVLTGDVYGDHGVQWEYVNATLVFGAKGRPRQVSIAWTNYETNVGWAFDTIESEIEGEGTTIYPPFRETEPEVIWHAPLKRRPTPEFVVPARQEPPTVAVPVVSVALAVLLLAGFLVARRRGVPARERWIGAGVGLALVMGLASVAPIDVAVPWGGGFERPDDEEALYVFEALHRNVYRAFDYDTEDDIYDTLAKSVTGDLLDDIYAEVHQSLVMQNEGGAVCEIQRVEILTKDVMPADDPSTPYFRVRARWKVEGRVGHWGHTHQRINEYEAVFTIVSLPDGWRIAKMDVLEQSRTDDGETR